jgi:histidinol dehydrogenase
MKLISTAGRGRTAARQRVDELIARRSATYERALPAAKRIVDGVRRGGDRTLRRYAAQFDGLSPQTQLRISKDEIQAAWQTTSGDLKQALKTAAKNIRSFAERQRPKEWDFAPVSGVKTGQRIRPICAVGCYVPSGRYPLPSTLLMTVIPAQVAGVERIVVVSPRPAQETLAAAALLGITEMYRLGGGQAIAALAYGTDTVARVDKIVGPGNAFVTAAKKLVAFDCAIDMLAGPTEIVVTSESGDPAGIAADLVAQAEHDPEALAVLITSNSEIAEAVLAEVKAQAKGNAIAKQSLAAQGCIFVTATVSEAQELTNRLAPEHLTVDSPADLKWIKNAGSVFVGAYAPQSMGDYVSGPNHVLPTGRVGRVRGGLSVADFVKVITVQEYTRKGLRKMGPHAIALAVAEGLTGHAESVRVRMR